MTTKERAALLRKYKADEKLYNLWNQLYKLDAGSAPVRIESFGQTRYPQFSPTVEQRRSTIANKISAHIEKNYSKLFTA